MIQPGLRGALHVSGCTSDAGKSTVVAGLCRLLARRGVSVAPFKAQNMALNSYVTRTGDEIGRAQGAQALAAGLEPDVAMNPILLKPTGERSSQVVVMGQPVGVMTAAEYHEHKPELRALVLDALGELRRRFDVVLCEGAGSPTEINLLAHDIVNLSIARDGGMRSVVVGDIDRGGVFAHLYGTVALLPEDLRSTVGGFLINRFRGDPALLGDGMAQLEVACGVPTLGVLPMLPGMWLDGEDSVALGVPVPSAGPARADPLSIVAIRFPQLSNYTDLDALALEPGIAVRYVADAASIGRPDLVVLPGSKETVADLAWLRAQGMPPAIEESGAEVIGICAGYQMLGDTIVDHVEARVGSVAGLGWLSGVHTTFGADKVLRQHAGALAGGYQIHHGRVAGPAGAGWVPLDDGAEGTVRADGSVRGTTLHGLFEHDGFRTSFLVDLAARRGKRFVPAGIGFASARQARFDAIADAIEAHVDLAALEALIAQA
ncbi:MAG TPA: cobyric acid synthase [Acidimicrobiales bacterium]|nr:cobyric acid synthase [Acidimicrobiales bacterium]